MTAPVAASGAIRVLLIEDSDADARLFELALNRVERGRFHCTRADRLQAGRDRFRQESFDVVVLDLSLPDSEGSRTFTAMHEVACQSPIVVVTGYENDALAAELVEAGAWGVLVKGDYSGAELAQALRDAAGVESTP